VGDFGALGPRDRFFRRYLELAPAALALERSIECDILAEKKWLRPVLDLGCGDGIFAHVMFADRVDTGIDLNPMEVEKARALHAYHELIVCPGDRIPKPDGAFATAFSNSVLEHIASLPPVLREIHRLLRPEGMLYITIPTDRLERATFLARVLSGVGLSSLAERYGKFYCRFWRHYHAYGEVRWRQLLEDSGFEIVEERAYVPANLSTFYDLLTHVALPSLVFKLTLGRWVLSPSLRRVSAGFIHAVLAPIVARLRREKGGCLVFYALRKRNVG
jgi:SAM-dependent methyltransferase